MACCFLVSQRILLFNFQCDISYFYNFLPVANNDERYAAGTIPITIFIALGIFYAFGIELNTVTLAALIVTLGMIVDNSIVIIDCYIEKIDEGMSRWHAASLSAKEFFSSIFSATLAISITFFPLLITNYR